MVQKVVYMFDLHGIGGNKANSHVEGMKNVGKALGKNYTIEYRAVKYLEDINENQEELLDRLAEMGVDKTREFLLGALSDAIVLERYGYLYVDVMNQITEAMMDLVDLPYEIDVHVRTHSLGCHIFSCWLYDRQKKGFNDSYIKSWFSTGNNMVAQLSGIKLKDMEPIKKPCEEFVWLNFWSGKDPLGYPMKKINTAYYNMIEKDIKVWGAWFISHLRYDKKKKVNKAIAKRIKEISG